MSVPSGAFLSASYRVYLSALLGAHMSVPSGAFWSASLGGGALVDPIGDIHLGPIGDNALHQSNWGYFHKPHWGLVGLIGSAAVGPVGSIPLGPIGGTCVSLITLGEHLSAPLMAYLLAPTGVYSGIRPTTGTLGNPIRGAHTSHVPGE